MFKTFFSPGQGSSVGWVSSCKLKGRGFNSRSGHTPGLRVQSPAAVCARGSGSMFLSHIGVSLPLPLSLDSIKEMGFF